MELTNHWVGAASITLFTANHEARRQTHHVFFLCTIFLAVSFHNYLHLPPFFGMMTGLAILKFYGFYLRKTYNAVLFGRRLYGEIGDQTPFDSFREVSRVEWDTFFRHLRWTPAIALGCGLSIWLHLVINSGVADVLPYTLL